MSSWVRVSGYRSEWSSAYGDPQKLSLIVSIPAAVVCVYIPVIYCGGMTDLVSGTRENDRRLNAVSSYHDSRILNTVFSNPVNILVCLLIAYQ